MKYSTTLCLVMIGAVACSEGGSGSADPSGGGSSSTVDAGSAGSGGVDSQTPTTGAQETTASGGVETSQGPGSAETSISGGPDTQATQATQDTKDATGEDSSSGPVSGSSGEGSTSGLVPGECGDGVHNLGEECDDGNFDNTDACTEYCKDPACGDGYVQAGETCDDGNQVDGDGCNVDCFGSGDAVWTVLFDGEDHLDDHGHAVAVDGAGAVVVTGSTAVPMEDTNVLLWKVAGADGSEVWHRDVPGVGPDVGYDVDTNSANEIVATGALHVPAMPDPGQKIWTAGFAPNGNEKWSGKTAIDGTGRAIVVAPDDSVYATGDVAGMNGPNLWLERRDAAGVSAWITQDVYGDDSSCDLDYYENPEGVEVDPPHVYVAWRSTCPGGQFPAAPSSKVSRFTDDGVETQNPDPCCNEWRIDLFTPGVFQGVPTRAFDMAKAPEGELVIAGEANGGGWLWGYGPDLYSEQTYNSAHWEGSPGGENFVDVAIDGEGNIVLAGDGGRVVKTDPMGQLLWEHSAPEATIRGVAVDAGGYVYAVGSADGEGKDVWLRKLAP